MIIIATVFVKLSHDRKIFIYNSCEFKIYKTQANKYSNVKNKLHWNHKLTSLPYELTTSAEHLTNI